MRFLYVNLNNWFEFEGKKYKKVASCTAQLNGKGNNITFSNLAHVEACDEPKPVRRRPKTDTLPPVQDLVEESQVLTEEKEGLEALDGED